MKRFLSFYALFLLVIVFSNNILLSCFSVPSKIDGLIGIDEAIKMAATTVAEKAQQGDRVAVMQIKCTTTALSKYISDEFYKQLDEINKLNVFERGENLKNVHAEQEFQMSGFVSDESAAGIGHFLGVKLIISGDFTQFANFSQISIRAVDVETARVVAVYSEKISSDDPIVNSINSTNISDKTIVSSKIQVSETALEHFNFGKEYLAANAPNIAIEEFNKTISMNKNFVEALLYRGVSYLALWKGPSSEGYKDYNDNKQMRQNDIKTCNNALMDYSSVLKNNSNDYYAYNHRARAYNMIAISYNSSYYTVSSPGIHWQHEGDSKKAHEYWELAIVDATRALIINPNIAYTYTMRGMVYMNLGDYNRARIDFNKALAIDSYDSDAQRAISFLNEKGL
jgi:tetratricopeptide (TPR) repeat protein